MKITMLTIEDIRTLLPETKGAWWSKSLLTRLSA